MPYRTLISVEELAPHLGDPNWRIVDCRFDLAQPQAGEAAYQVEHIPGAIYAHLDRDLSGPVTAASGRHPLPDPAKLCERFSNWGIGPETQVVCYDLQGGAIASRLWWLLRWLGHEAVAVLDGGLQRWMTVYRVFDASLPQIQARKFSGRPDNRLVIDSQALVAELAQPGGVLIDVRAPERFRGEVEPLDTRAGHIPGAINLPYPDNLQADGRYRPAAELKAIYASVLGDTAAGDCAVMCGSGVTACHTLLALELAGLHGARLYAGSWSEWIRDPARPIATSE